MKIYGITRYGTLFQLGGAFCLYWSQNDKKEFERYAAVTGDMVFALDVGNASGWSKFHMVS